MIIGIDGNEANVETKVGISEYAFQLLTQLSNSKFQISNSKFVIYLKSSPRNEMPKEREGWTYRIVSPKKLWTQIALPLDLFLHKPRPDVFFTPTHYAPRFSPVPTIVSIMDLSYIFFPELFNASDLYQLKSWTSYSVKNAKKVITISNSSKNDILKEYRLPESKIAVTYLGIKSVGAIQKMPMKDLQGKYGIEEKFILFVGTLQPRKNIVRLIESFAKIADSLKQTSLVIVGKHGWLYEDILSAPKKFGVEGKVKFVHFVSNDELVAFYKNAQFFVLPSLYEGFGLPVLEAMSYGCPVITSNVSSMPEAGGDAALYVDPESVDDMAKKMLELAQSKKLQEELREKGYQQVKKFSWEKTAKETLKILEDVAGIKSV